jgi:hypothetical protein
MIKKIFRDFIFYLIKLVGNCQSIPTYSNLLARLEPNQEEPVRCSKAALPYKQELPPPHTHTKRLSGINHEAY